VGCLSTAVRAIPGPSLTESLFKPNLDHYTLGEVDFTESFSDVGWHRPHAHWHRGLR
jgi:hypothetical protein